MQEAQKEGRFPGDFEFGQAVEGVGAGGCNPRSTLLMCRMRS